jgi:hypothetical protein
MMMMMMMVMLILMIIVVTIMIMIIEMLVIKDGKKTNSTILDRPHICNACIVNSSL